MSGRRVAIVGLVLVAVALGYVAVRALTDLDPAATVANPRPVATAAPPTDTPPPQVAEQPASQPQVQSATRRSSVPEQDVEPRRRRQRDGGAVVDVDDGSVSQGENESGHSHVSKHRSGQGRGDDEGGD